MPENTEAIETPEVKPPAKPGYKTSEFWLILLSQIIGAVLSTGLLAPDSVELKIIGAAGAVLTALGYGFMRTMAKK